MVEQRLLTHQDELALRVFLLREPLYNLFMIGDLEMLGLDAEVLHFWGQFSPRGELVGVAMRYYANWCFRCEAAADWSVFARLVDGLADNRVINGHPQQVEPIVARLERYTVAELHASYYCRMPLHTRLVVRSWPTRRAVLSDVEELTAFYDGAGIMRRDAQTLRRQLTEGRRMVVVEDGGRIVSAAMTSVETSNAAMIGGVFTPEPWRNRGYASAAMTHLCAELIQAGKQPCLFYDNPAAGSIYRRLGFEDIGPWHMVLLNRKMSAPVAGMV